MKELYNQKELEAVIVEGHSIVLFTSTLCSACNKFAPVWHDTINTKIQKPKWKFYTMNELVAGPILNRVQINRLPQVIVFDCPQQPLNKRAVVIQCTANAFQRCAYAVDFNSNSTSNEIISSLKPWLDQECQCLVHEESNISTLPQHVDVPIKSPQPQKYLDYFHNAINISPLIDDELFDWIKDTVLFAEDPVLFWRKRNAITI